MLFNTVDFWLFFALVFALYRALPLRGQNVLLLIASYVFYAWWDWRFCGLLALSTGVDYAVGLALRRSERGGSEGGRRRAWLLVSLCVNLGILGFFKYFDFFTRSAAAALTQLGLEPNLPLLEIILPVGISFYTFQTLGYTIDVYRRRMEPTRDLLAFAVYVAYFPQLVAGPIERASHLLPILQAPRRITAAALRSGAMLVLIGLLRKVAIADAVAPTVNAIFHAPEGRSSFELFQGVFLFGLQIYGDFAGYTDIARGVSRMLGIELMENFRRPYFAPNITEFWRRWHISLSTWLRDYLYIPLGGNRGGTWSTYRNLLLTMLLGGLWHGAAWTFVIWGGLHGGALAVHKLFARAVRLGRFPTLQGGSHRLAVGGSWLLTMAFVGFAWVFFRTSGLARAWGIVEGILACEGPVSSRGLAQMGAATLALLVIDIPQEVAGEHTVMLRWPGWLRGTLYACAALALITFWSADDTPFIYFQF